MTLRAFLPVVAVACLFLTDIEGAAVAQPDTGHIVQHYDRARIRDGETTGIEAQKILYRYAACLAKGGRKQVELFLSTTPFSERADKIARKIALDECLMEGEFVVQPEAFRGPLYQALYRQDFAKKAPADVMHARQLDFSQGTGDGSANTMLRVFGDCVVRTDAGAARALVLSDVGTAEESLAVQQVMPAMSACIKPGDTLKLTRPLVRGIVAEVLYRLTAAASGTLASADRK